MQRVQTCQPSQGPRAFLLTGTIKPVKPHKLDESCAIECFGGIFVLSFRFFYISDGKGAFVVGLSQIVFSLIFS